MFAGRTIANRKVGAQDEINQRKKKKQELLKSTVAVSFGYQKKTHKRVSHQQRDSGYFTMKTNTTTND